MVNMVKKYFKRERMIQALVCACCLLTVTTLSKLTLYAQTQPDYPTKPIRIIMPTAPGGSLDTIGRLIAQKLSDTLKKQVIIDNRPGAGGIIGTEIAAKAEPDGYTLLISSSGNIATTQALYKKISYDPVRDFTTVILMAETPYIVVVNPSLPVKTVSELIKFAKEHPGRLNYASSGNGSTPHLAGELFKSMAGIDVVHVPYKGSPPSLTSLVSGETMFQITGMPSSWPHVEAGRMRVLAVASAKRLTSAPDLPTVSESGLSGYEANSWAGMLAPTGTPRPIIDKLNREVTRILKTPEVEKQLLKFGFEVLGSSPEQFGAYLKSEIAKWSKVIREANVKQQ